MNRSEQINELAAALAKAQGAMKPALKDSANPFFKSSYADLASVWHVCQKPLTDNGLSVSMLTEYGESDVWLETILMHSSGQWISGKYPIRPIKNDPQGIGSAITYAKRYALAAMVGVVTEDDDGNAASGRETNPQRDAIHTNNTMPKDEDIEVGVKNWCAEQKTFLSHCAEIAEIQEWEELRADAIARLKRKALPAWSDLMRYKENIIGNINLASVK